MQTFLVYTKAVKTGTGTVNQELGRDSVSSELIQLEGTRDYIINKDGKLFKVIEKIVDLRSDEIRILVRAA